jgi:hypothetical protein
MKIGAPKMAVIAPVGSSRGAITTLAAVSASNTRNAPARADAGITSRLSAPVASRTRCGTTSPT